LKSEPDRGSSSPHRLTDDLGLSAVDSEYSWYLTTIQTSKELTHYIGNFWAEYSFIGSKLSQSKIDHKLSFGLSIKKRLSHQMYLLNLSYNNTFLPDPQNW